MFGGFGFPFPGMDGPGGMHGGGSGRREGEIDIAKCYEQLGVDRTASEKEVKQAYKRLAREHHPDRGGDAEKFKKINEAHEAILRFIGSQESTGPRRKTKDVVQPLEVTLEQLYTGHIKKIAITREVVDEEKGVQICSVCSGRGVKTETVRMGPMSQHMQYACGSCGGQGKSFETKRVCKDLEVHVPRGAPDNHKIVFREMANERPDAVAGDAVFMLKQQEHPEFKRKGADLYTERTISLVEALCGFQMELTHLDGRKLLIKSQPGDLVKPMAQGFDPLESTENKMEWELIEDADCPDVDNVAEAATVDVDTLKKACETQLKRQGIDVGAFVVDKNRAYFKQGTREELLAAKKTRKGCTMYVISDSSAKSVLRMMKAVKNEGMPTYKNPFLHGNLFLILKIEFPNSIDLESQVALRALLPPPLQVPTISDKDDVEVHTVTEIDPVTSFNSNKLNMNVGGEAYDDGERGCSGERPGGAQCHQM